MVYRSRGKVHNGGGVMATDGWLELEAERAYLCPQEGNRESEPKERQGYKLPKLLLGVKLSLTRLHLQKVP